MVRQDGAHAVSLADMIANAFLLARVTGLPVNGGLGDGYGLTAEDCVATVEATIAGGRPRRTWHLGYDRRPLPPNPRI